MLCRKMYIGARTVEKAEYGYPIGCLLGLTEAKGTKDDIDFDGEMLYLAGFSDEMLNLFLYQLRRNKLIIPLKAVQTETNMTFTSYELYRELCAEREAFQQGTPYHS